MRVTSTRWLRPTASLTALALLAAACADSDPPPVPEPAAAAEPQQATTTEPEPATTTEPQQATITEAEQGLVWADPTTTTTTVAPCSGVVSVAGRDVAYWLTPDGLCLPDDCVNDLARGGAECVTADGKTYTITDSGGWELAATPEAAPGAEAEAPESDPAPEAPEPGPDTTVPEPEPDTTTTTVAAEPESLCADLAEDPRVVVVSSPSDEILVDLSEPGRWRWTACTESDGPVAYVFVRGVGEVPGAGASVQFPGMDSEFGCHAEQPQSGRWRFSLSFSVTADAFDENAEMPPCWNPVVDGARGAWAGEYLVRVAVLDADRYGVAGHEAYFLAERLGD